MQIEINGRGVEVDDDLRSYAERRFAKVGRQVGEQSVLTIDLKLRNDTGAPEQVSADAALALKGVTLRASDDSGDARHAIHLVSDELAIQVKRHNEKRRGHRGASGDVAAA